MAGATNIEHLLTIFQPSSDHWNAKLIFVMGNTWVRGDEQQFEIHFSEHIEEKYFLEMGGKD